MRDDLPHAMRETARRLEPDVGRLTAGAVARGTRMRRLERAVQVLGSAVAVAVVFAGVTIGSHRGTGAGGGEREANQPAVSDGNSAPQTGGPTTTPATTPPRTVTSPTTPGPTATAQIAQSQLVTDLKESLAGTGVTGLSFTAIGTDTPPTSTTTATTNTTSTSTSTVAVRPTILVDAQLTTAKNVGFLSIVFSGPRDLAPRPGTPKPLPDGSVVYRSQGTGSSDGRHPDRAVLQVTLVRPDGSSLAATETNAATPKSAAVFADAPLLLSADQLVTLLGSPVWDGALAAADALPPADGAALVPPPSSTLLFTSLTPSSSSSP